MITHDIDCSHCILNVRDYMELEVSLRVQATYSMQTKYVKDWNDDMFYDASKVPLVESLVSTGMEVASHSVAHSRQLASFPMGSGVEAYPPYHPFVRNRTTTINGTIAGE